MGKSYFEKQYERFGNNWLMKTKPDQIQSATKQILRDIANDNVDLQKHGYLFYNNYLVDNIKTKCYNLMIEYNIILSGLKQLEVCNDNTNGINPIFIRDYNTKYSNLCKIFYEAYMCFNNISELINGPYGTNAINLIPLLKDKIKDVRQYLYDY